MMKQELALQIMHELGVNELLNIDNFTNANDCLNETYNVILEILDKYTIFNNDIMSILENYHLK